MTATPFLIIPAIDLKGGRCVRLRQGLEHEETVYGADPVAMARHWAEAGAPLLHVVDLDGAFQGAPAHFDMVARIAQAIAIPVEVGGGIRTAEQVRAYLAAGVSRVILGTRACTDRAGIRALAAEFGPGLVVGIDARQGQVQIKGWKETTALRAVDLAAAMEQEGVRTLIVTDTTRDGMLQGVNTAAMDAVCAAVGCTVVASGGVSSVADVRALRGLRRANLAGVIVGKALYDGAVTLADLIKEAQPDAF